METLKTAAYRDCAGKWQTWVMWREGLSCSKMHHQPAASISDMCSTAPRRMDRESWPSSIVQQAVVELLRFLVYRCSEVRALQPCARELLSHQHTGHRPACLPREAAPVVRTQLACTSCACAEMKAFMALVVLSLVATHGQAKCLTISDVIEKTPSLSLIKTAIAMVGIRMCFMRHATAHHGRLGMPCHAMSWHHHHVMLHTHAACGRNMLLAADSGQLCSCGSCVSQEALMSCQCLAPGLQMLHTNVAYMAMMGVTMCVSCFRHMVAQMMAPSPSWSCQGHF